MPSFSRVRFTGKCVCSTSRIICNFSDAGYLIPRRPHPRACFFEQVILQKCLGECLFKILRFSLELFDLMRKWGWCAPGRNMAGRKKFNQIQGQMTQTASLHVPETFIWCRRGFLFERPKFAPERSRMWQPMVQLFVIQGRGSNKRLIRISIGKDAISECNQMN